MLQQFNSNILYYYYIIRYSTVRTTLNIGGTYYTLLSGLLLVKLYGLYTGYC